MSRLTQGTVNWDDAFQVMTILQKAHRLVIQGEGKKIVWLLDRFDAAYRRLGAQTLSSLRSLRDQFKGQLCYVVAIRHPLSRLRDPREVDEFHEIVVANTCWVGPMVERDARWIARQMAERLNVSFSEVEIRQLIDVTGGLPAFMKLACIALAEGELSKGETSSTWTEKLLTRPEFQRNCQEIWDDLASEEQNALIALSAGADEQALEPDPVVYLEQTGLLVRPVPGEQATIFSPILSRFLIQQRGETAGVLELHPRTRAVLRNGVPLNIELTAHEDRLLSFFLERPGEICTKDILMRAVWPDEALLEGVRDDRLAQLIKRLREKIEPTLTKPTYIQTVRGRGYRFVQP
jgi:DNA-binding winged helix-turn-helix (wHTH) protein